MADQYVGKRERWARDEVRLDMVRAVPWVRDDHAFTWVAWCGRPWFGGIDVDGVVTSQNHRPMIIVMLSREEVGLCVPIGFGGSMPVVLMGGDEVVAKPTVGIERNGQPIVMAKQVRLAVAYNLQLGRKGAIKGP